MGMGVRTIVVLCVVAILLFTSGCFSNPLQPNPGSGGQKSIGPAGAPSSGSTPGAQGTSGAPVQAGIPDTSSPAGNVGSLGGNWSSFVTTDPSIAHPNFTAKTNSLKIFQNGWFGYFVGLKKPDGITWGVVFAGRYHVNGNSIQFTDIVMYNFPDASKPEHTSKKIPDATSSFVISQDGNTLNLRDGLVVGEAELQRDTEDQPTSISGNPASSTSSGSADAIIGHWTYLNFWVFNNEYGQYSRTSNIGISYWFEKDGTYKFLEMGSGNGASDITINDEGKYRVNGNTITVYDVITTIRNGNGQITAHGKASNYTLTFRVINKNTISITNNLGGVKDTYTFNRDTPPK